MAQAVALIGIGEAIYDQIFYGQPTFYFEKWKIFTLCLTFCFQFVRRDGLYDVQMIQRLIGHIAISICYLMTTTFLKEIWPSSPMISIEHGTVFGLEFSMTCGVLLMVGIASYILYLAATKAIFRPIRRRLHGLELHYEQITRIVTSRVVVLLLRAVTNLMRLICSKLYSNWTRKRRTAQRYTHERLKLGQIRLLIIHRRVPYSPLQCTLITTKLEEAPSYEAISYTWGTASDIREMYVNDRPFNTSKATYDALCSRSSMWRERTLWIDYLCINQQDLAEKSVQVAGMNEIYKRATHVVVYLGDSSRSFLAMLTMHNLLLWRHGKASDAEMTQHFAKLALTARWRALEDFLDHAWFSRVWIIQEIAFAKKIYIICGGMRYNWHDFTQLVDIFSSLGMNSLLQSTPTGRRAKAGLTMLRDICLARVGVQTHTAIETIYKMYAVLDKIGPVSEDTEAVVWRVVIFTLKKLMREYQYLPNVSQVQPKLDCMANLISYMEIEYEMGLSKPGSTSKSGGLNYEDLKEDMGSEPGLSTSSSQEKETDGFASELLRSALRQQRKLHSLPILLHRFAEFKATDPRDKIYALHGLMLLGGKSKLRTNYSISATDLYIRVALAVWSTEAPFQLIAYAGIGDERNLELPSWVPDWSRVPRSSPLTGPDTSRDPDYRSYAACGTTNPQIKLHSSIPYAVVVQGVHVDMIASLTSTASPSGTDASDETMNQYGQVLRTKQNMDLISWYDEARILAMKTLDGRGLDKSIDIFWRTLLGDSTKTHRPAPAKMLEGYNLFSRRVELMRDICLNGGSNASVLDEFYELDNNEMLTAFHMNGGRCSLGRRMCATEGGLLGFVPPLSQIGDIVVIASGAATPWLLRPVPQQSDTRDHIIVGEEEYNLVGECYIHEIMDGEKMDEALLRPFTIK